MRHQIAVLVRHIHGDRTMLVIDAMQEIALLHVVFRVLLDELAFSLKLDDGDCLVHL